MTIWKPDLASREGPLYRELADAIAFAVEAGELRSGDRLPTQRDLAQELGIALTTVTRGYGEAERRGLVRGEVGRGTFVRPRSVRGGAAFGDPGAGAVDLRPNVSIPWPLAPELLDRMARQLTEGDPTVLFGYAPHHGNPRHREAGAQWMEQAGLPTSPDQVVVTTGAQHAMAVTFATLTRPGDTVLVEELTYGGMRSLAHVLGIRLRPVAMDDEGIRPDALREALAAGPGDGAPKALYCTPTLQNPTSGVMSEPRRREIAAIADGAGLPVVEDDSYGFILPEVVPLSGHAKISYYLIGTSKSLLPALRVGFVRAPREMTDRLAATIAATVYTTSPLLADVVAQWIRDGTAERVMRWKREQIAIRQGVARAALAGADYQAHPKGPHGWIRLPEPWTTREFVNQAAMRRVHVSPADDFCVGRSAPHAVRICVGPAPSRALLQDALAALADMLQAGPDAGRVVV